MIWLAAAILVMLALLGLSLPWWWPAFARPRGVARRATNVQLYQERLAQLPGEVASGAITAEAAEELKAELGARLLQDAEGPAEAAASAPAGLAPVVVVGLLVTFAGAWYLVSGSWRTQALIDLARTNPEAAHLIAVDQAIADLEQRVRKQPDDADSWVWLGRSYRGRERFDDAVHAFAQASAAKGGQDPDILAEWGEAIAYSHEGSLSGEAAEKFEAALKIAPDHPRALWYGGVAALHAGDDRTAIDHWERLLKTDLPEDMRAPLAARVAELRKRNHMPPAVAAAAPKAAVLNIAVKITAPMQKLVAPTDRVFVYAVDPAGPPMPLAVKTFDAASLAGLTVRLTDADGPMPTRTLSSVNRWRVMARVSKSGTAMPQAGDLEGSVEVTRGEAGALVTVTIDRQRP